MHLLPTTRALINSLAPAVKQVKVAVMAFFSALLFCAITLHAQVKYLSLQQQQQDFDIFKTGLNEGHAGLYYYIDKNTFVGKCDSIARTFKQQEKPENFYLKLRFLISCLHHGHTRINLPTQGWVNYKMGVLDSTRLYLPFQLLILNNKLVIKEDCSREQLLPRYTVIKSINNIKAEDLIHNMLPYMPADGINETFKLYTLYNYFNFHYLFNLFYPVSKGVKIEIAGNNTHYYIELLKPRTIDSIYIAKNKCSISQYSSQLGYKAGTSPKTAYLRVGSFYKGLIEQFGQQYSTYIDSVFADVRANKTQNLVLDLRNNAGGGEGYDNILLAYLINNTVAAKPFVTVAGKQFTTNKYAVNLNDDVKGYIDNPGEFLRDDSTLLIKDKYVDMMTEGVIGQPVNQFTGRIIVLMNGGSFSAANTVIGALYYNRQATGRQVTFIGEENGGDIYSKSGCAGQGYTIKLPNSAIEVDMPFLCFGKLDKHYPRKRLPDFTVYDSVKSLQEGKDAVLNFAADYIKTH